MWWPQNSLFRAKVWLPKTVYYFTSDHCEFQFHWSVGPDLVYKCGNQNNIQQRDKSLLCSHEKGNNIYIGYQWVCNNLILTTKVPCMSPVPTCSLDMQRFSFIHCHRIIHTRLTARETSGMTKSTYHLITMVTTNMTDGICNISTQFIIPIFR